MAHGMSGLLDTSSMRSLADLPPSARDAVLMDILDRSLPERQPGWPVAVPDVG